MEWIQVYDPLHSAWLSPLLAAAPILVLLVALGVLQWRAHWSAALGLGLALSLAVTVFGMPADAAVASAAYGAAYGLLPIGWIIFNGVFLFNLTVSTGQFDILRGSVARLSADRRIQALVIAFSFGAFIEGAAGFGTPVAITAALLIGLGFPSLWAAGLSLIANTAPVAFGALGSPIFALAGVTGLPAKTLGMMAGRQLPLMSCLIPAWLVVTMSGWRGLKGVWPAVVVAGGTFAIVQFAWSNAVGPELVDIVGGLVSLTAVTILCRWWTPQEIWEFAPSPQRSAALPRAHLSDAPATADGVLPKAWMPWVFLSVFVFTWGLAPIKLLLTVGPAAAVSFWQSGTAATPSHLLAPVFDVPRLHQRVFRDYPVAEAVDRSRLSDPAYKTRRAEPARFTFNWLSATGTAILLAALVTAVYLRVPPRRLLRVAGFTLTRTRSALVTIALMLGLGFVTRYSGTDATLGLAFTHTGVMYPLFAALLGWLGVALTGSDTSSNVLFGGLQKITAQQLGLNPVLICTANSTGGVMGKMVDAQSIVVSTAATGQVGQEGKILRFVFWHSVALAFLMGLLVLAQAYLVPWMIPRV